MCMQNDSNINAIYTAKYALSRVAVLRPLPSDVSVSATRILALGGGGGKGGGGKGGGERGLQPHSVLGTTEEYTAQLAAQGMVSGESREQRIE